jgi:type II secretory pathway predicted ATPase ExeA
MRQPIYRSLFGFNREPFSIELNPDEVFTTPALSQFTERFDYIVRLGAIGLLTGEVGAGKSTALRFASSRLRQVSP